MWASEVCRLLGYVGKAMNARTRREGRQKEILLSMDEIVLYETKESQGSGLPEEMQATRKSRDRHSS